MSLNVGGDLGVPQVCAGAWELALEAGWVDPGGEQEEGAAASAITSFASQQSCGAQRCRAELRAGHQRSRCLWCLAARAGSLQSLLKEEFIFLTTHSTAE